MAVYSFIVRKAKPEDAKDVHEVLQEAFKKYMEDTGLTQTMEALSESEDDIREAIKSKCVYLAYVNDIPVGTIRFDVKDDKTAYISRFGVKLDYHNIGIGKSLMNLIDAQIKELGISKAYLYTASKYTDLMRFYYGRGFYVESTSTDRGYIRAKMVKEYS